VTSSYALLQLQLLQLQARYDDLQKQTGSQAALLAEVGTLNGDLEKARSSYRNVEDSIEVSQVWLTWRGNIYHHQYDDIIAGTVKYSDVEYPF